MAEYYSQAELDAMDAGETLFDTNDDEATKLPNGNWTYFPEENRDLYPGFRSSDMTHDFLKPIQDDPDAKEPQAPSVVFNVNNTTPDASKIQVGEVRLEPTLEQLVAVAEVYRDPVTVVRADGEGTGVMYPSEESITYLFSEIDKRIGYHGK